MTAPPATSDTAIPAEETKAQRYRRLHPDRVKESYKKWAAKNKDYLYDRNRVRAVTESAKEWRKEYFQRTKEHQREKNKAWRHSNPEKMKEIAKRAKIVRPWNAYIQAAKQRGLAYELSKDEVLALVQARCHYCGDTGKPYVGIDRKDNNVGYVQGNVYPCCKRCNWAKGTEDYDEFVAWLQRAAQFIVGKKDGEMNVQ